MYSSGARLGEQDVIDLNRASDKLAVVADQIKRANPTWAGAAVQLLIEANDVIVRIQTKGARAFARYLEKHGLQSAQDAPEISAAGDDADQGPKSRRDEPEA